MTCNYECHDFDPRTIEHVREAIAAARDGISEGSTPTAMMISNRIDYLAIVPDDDEPLDHLIMDGGTSAVLEIFDTAEA